MQQSCRIEEARGRAGGSDHSSSGQVLIAPGGFVIPVPTKNLKVYRRIAQKFGKVWRDHGALEFRECVADDVKVGKWTSFPRSVKLKRGETVVWSYIVYKSRSHRDRVNAKVMKDPRMTSIMNPKALPFDGKRMIFGGFKVLVEG